MTTVPVKKRKRRLRKEFKYGLIGLAILILVILIFTVFIPSSTRRKITKLGYSKESAVAIMEQKLTNTVLEKEYSEALDENLKRGIKVAEHFDLYYVTTNVNDEIIHLNDILLKKGYAKEDALKCFANLSFKEITPLLVFNNVTNMDDYIQDVTSHRTIQNVFVKNDYTKYYENVSQVEDAAALDVIVNKYNMISTDYVPDVVSCSRQYASEGVELRSEAYEAFKEMEADMLAAGVEGIRGVYITSGYRNAELQKELYDRYLNSKGELYADAYSARPGSSEHQLGLSMDITATNKESLEFDTTEEYAWISVNCHKYGFILRYPASGEKITGYSFEPWHYRFVGEELATKIYNSGLTFDEYYELYMRDYSTAEGK